MLVLKKSKLLICYLMIIVMLGSLSTSLADAATQATKAYIGQVKIATKSFIRVKNVQLIPNNDKQTLAYTIEIVNNENKSISFFDYWTKVKLTSGALIPTKLTKTNSNKNEISPKTTVEYTFVGTVNRATKYSEITIQLIKWDFSVANYARILGIVKIPATYSPVNNDKSVVVEGTKLAVNFKNFVTYQLEEEKRTEFEIEYTNQGYKAVTIPKYKYYFITPDQYVYEITPIKTEDVKIQPKAKASISMKMNIPTSVNVTTGNISIVFNDEEAKIEVPMSTFKVKLENTVATDKTEVIGTEKSFTIDSKKYAVRLDSVQQLPFNDENIVTSIVTLFNKSSEVVPIPDIVGVYYLDGVEIAADKVKKTQLDSGVGIPANGKVRVAIHTKTPYNSSYSNLKLDVSNQIKTGSEEVIKEKITTYSVSKNSFAGFTKVPVGSDIDLVTSGRTSMYKVYSLETYESSNSYLYNVLLEVQNKDTRASDISKLAAHFKTQNNSYFPVKISEVKEKINPSGKVLISLSAKIPKYSNTNSMKLVLGELIDENTYLSAAEFEMPAEDQSSTSGTLKDLSIYPYKLSINAITVDLDSNANINFQYELSKAVEYDSAPDGHSIIVEVVDKEATYSKEYKFETDLELGIHKQTMVASMNIENPGLKITQMDGLKVNIYDLYEGHKKLLGSRMVYSIFIK